MSAYLSIVLFFSCSSLVAVGLLVLPFVLAPKRPYANKNAPYECGFKPFSHSKQIRFHSRFYLIAILFMVFDLEIALLFPWALAWEQIGVVGFFSVFSFLMILTMGFIYEWKKGALEWD